MKFVANAYLTIRETCEISQAKNVPDYFFNVTIIYVKIEPGMSRNLRGS